MGKSVFLEGCAMAVVDFEHIEASSFHNRTAIGLIQRCGGRMHSAQNMAYTLLYQTQEMGCFFL